MGILQTFGWGSKKIMAGNHTVPGRVTGVKTCWWLKVNTKHFRLHALDGAKFPHIIAFSYSVQGTAYQGSWYVRYFLRCPRPGETITVFYDPVHPARYAVSLFILDIGAPP